MVPPTVRLSLSTSFNLDNLSQMHPETVSMVTLNTIKLTNKSIIIITVTVVGESSWWPFGALMASDPRPPETKGQPICPLPRHCSSFICENLVIKQQEPTWVNLMKKLLFRKGPEKD